MDSIESTSKSVTLAGHAAASCDVFVNMNRGARPAWLLGSDEAWSQDDDSVGVQAPGDGYFPEIGPGRDTNTSVGAIRWAVSLSKLWNGQTAGMIRLTETGIGDEIYTPGALYYTALSVDPAEVNVISTGTGDLHQILVPQALVVIESTSSPQQCIVKFYAPTQIAGMSSGFYQVTDTNNPAVAWIIKNPGSPNTVQFIEQREFQNGTPTRVNTSAVQFDSASSTWSVVTGSGGEQTTTTRAIAISGTDTRTETVQITSVASGLAYKATETYKNYQWGWELTSVVTDPGAGGTGLSHSFIYNEVKNAQAPAAYGKLRDHYFPGGRWERTYYSGEVCTFALNGVPGDKQLVITPWTNGPSSPVDANFSNAKVSAQTTHWADGALHYDWVEEATSPGGGMSFSGNTSDSTVAGTPGITYSEQWRGGGYGSIRGSV